MQTIKQLIDIILHFDIYLSHFTAIYGFFVYIFLIAIIFSETAFIFAAILPGDSLLFASGMLAARGQLKIYYLLIFLSLAAIIGNIINYFIGLTIGHLLFKNENSKIFKKSYLNKAHNYYDKFGGKTLIIAGFIPIIRTFAPFIAGMGQMNKIKFLIYNVIGATAWIIIITYISFCFGNIPIVRDHFTFVIYLIIVTSILPATIQYIIYKCRDQLKNSKR